MDPQSRFKECLKARGLKTTEQRTVLLDLFLQQKKHLSIEELYVKVRKKNPSIGYATVYRTLKLFAECGIAKEQNFGDGHARYEPCHAEEHHDHLICTACGAIIEFEHPGIEQFQQTIAREHGFQLESHRLDLFGLCALCQKKQL